MVVNSLAHSKIFRYFATFVTVQGSLVRQILVTDISSNLTNNVKGSLKNELADPIDQLSHSLTVLLTQK